ncbi:MAG: dTDP-glucose 4,6-dehydratase, partial [Chitinophagales bacterium]
ENLRDVENAHNYQFIRGDIVDAPYIDKIFQQHRFNGVIHLAAESHVDRSIVSPMDFISTNIIGTVNLLNAARSLWENQKAESRDHKFYHISTDEVFGSLGDDGYFTESTPYDPKSPYSASKASADHLVRAYSHTYGLPAVITNCSNNYGPFHFPEKLIPLAINNMKSMKRVPVYSKGENVRDWLYVEDHAAAIDLVFHKGEPGSNYNIGGFNEWKNIDLIMLLCRIMDEKLHRPAGTSEQLITYVKDRPGHDLRYAIDSSKISGELGWKPLVTFEEGLRRTVDWYLANEEWLMHVTSGEYLKYYQQQYYNR